MDIQARKYHIIQWLVNLRDVSLIEQIEELAQENAASGPNEDWWETLPANMKASLEKGHKQYLEGKTISHEEARKSLKEKFNL